MRTIDLACVYVALLGSCVACVVLMHVAVAAGIPMIK
jgi:hypothetical protein